MPFRTHRVTCRCGLAFHRWRGEYRNEHRLGLSLLGLLMNITWSCLAWVFAFATGTLFAFLTLPVELNASSRAMQLLTNNGLIDRTEYGQARSVLNAAAFTYIAGLLASVLNLLYYVMLASGTGRRR